MRNTNIELYLKYSNNQQVYEEIYQRSFNELLQEIELEFSILSLKELMEIYLYYSKPTRLKSNYMNNLLILVYEVITERLSQFKPIDVVDNYVELCNSLIALNDNIQSYQNIIQVRTYNLEDDFFISNQAIRSHKSIENFIKNYQKEIVDFKDILEISNSSNNYLDKLKNSIKDYLDNLINDLDEEEKKELIQEINKRIDVHSQKLLYQKRLLSNKKIFDIEMRLNNLDSSNIQDKFNFSNAKNKLSVYEDYRNKLINKTKKSGI
ncbi:MAG: hypothetical protein ACI4WF_01855 [Bacilli bacterium]